MISRACLRYRTTIRAGSQQISWAPCNPALYIMTLPVRCPARRSRAAGQPSATSAPGGPTCRQLSIHRRRQAMTTQEGYHSASCPRSRGSAWALGEMCPSVPSKQAWPITGETRPLIASMLCFYTCRQVCLMLRFRSWSEVLAASRPHLPVMLPAHWMDGSPVYKKWVFIIIAVLALAWSTDLHSVCPPLHRKQSCCSALSICAGGLYCGRKCVYGSCHSRRMSEFSECVEDLEISDLCTANLNLTQEMRMWHTGNTSRTTPSIFRGRQFPGTPLTPISTFFFMTFESFPFVFYVHNVLCHAKACWAFHRQHRLSWWSFFDGQGTPAESLQRLAAAPSTPVLLFSFLFTFWFTIISIQYYMKSSGRSWWKEHYFPSIFLHSDWASMWDLKRNRLDRFWVLPSRERQQRHSVDLAKVSRPASESLDDVSAFRRERLANRRCASGSSESNSLVQGD